MSTSVVGEISYNNKIFRVRPSFIGYNWEREIVPIYIHIAEIPILSH